MSKITGLCNHLKSLIIPQTPDVFTVAAPFRHGRSNDELKQSIAAFRSFLCKFYDKIIADANMYTTKKSEEYKTHDHFRGYFPIIIDAANLLYALGLHGKLEAGTNNRLVCDIGTLMAVNTKTPKLELFNFLFDLGFYFEGIDLSGEAGLPQTGIVDVECDNDFLMLGMKLLAEAQANTKPLHNVIENGFLCGDFYPLANAVPKARVVYLKDFAHCKTPAIKEWLSKIDAVLTENGCKVAAKKTGERGIAVFDYTAAKTKLKICRIELNMKGAKLTLYGHHFAAENNIIGKLPEEMLNKLKTNIGCKPCMGPKICPMPGRYYVFIHNTVEYTCCGNGFGFALNESAELGLLEEWLRLEAAYCNDKSALETVNKAQAGSSHDNRWAKRGTAKKDGEISVFEMTNTQQRTHKPPIDDACDYFLKNSVLKQTATHILEIVRKLGFEPKWRSKNKYACVHKTQDIIAFRFEGENDFNIVIPTFSWKEKTSDFIDFMQGLPQAVREKYIAQKEFHCTHCREECKHAVKFDLHGDEVLACSRASYISENPIEHQLALIEWLVKLGINYIDYKKPDKGEFI